MSSEAIGGPPQARVLQNQKKETSRLKAGDRLSVRSFHVRSLETHFQVFHPVKCAELVLNFLVFIFDLICFPDFGASLIAIEECYF